MTCGTLIIPPLDRPSDNTDNGFQIPSERWDDLDQWSWIPVEVPQYKPPTLEDLPLGAEPPAVPDIPFANPRQPYLAGDASITPPQFDAPPVLDATPPSIYEPPQPEDFTGERPGDAPEVSDVVVPEAPIIVVPEPPIISDIILPELLDLDLPVFDGQMPDGSDIIAPHNTFNFTEEEYNSDVLDKTTSEILRMLDGGVGIPDTTWQLILQQGAEREEQSGSKLVEEATTEWASRGWSAPGGVLNMQIREAQQKVFMARNTLAREVTIKESEMELENLKYAIAQGIALDTMLIGLHNSAQDRGLKAAEIGVRISIDIMNAKISLYNAELAAYQASAMVYKTMIDAEMAKVEIYKAEIEGVTLLLEADKTKIEAYNAYIRGLSMIVELHNSQVQTVLAEVEIEKARIDAYKSRVEAYSEEVRAWGLEWDGYKAAWDGQLSKAGIYKTTVDAYASEVAGYASVAKVEEIKIDAEKSTITLDIERMKSDTARYSSEVNYQSERADATAKTYTAQMAGYSAKAQYDGNKVKVYEARLQGDIANARATSSAAIENARIVASQLEAIQKINASMEETKSNIEAQIQASTIGQFSSRTSFSSSLQTGYSYNCDS
ncbi:MAG: hypothetical protein DRI24_18965 [Deltaproteobacteria bacterium]|nr:MAG: hypothetical protein DRI24_18965 [Deltaproteobacteria bacterium]